MALLIVFLCVAELLTLNLYVRERRDRKRRTLTSRWPIPPVSLDQVDPIFTPGPYGPSVATEVSFIGRGPIQAQGSTSDAESWILAVLAKHSRCLFEFGTCTGRTAYLWARNSPPDARVVTLTLAPEQVNDYHRDAADDETDTAAALSESAYESFLYSGTPSETKIEQLFGDSKALDASRWSDQCDLVFVDGSHAYSYVKSDSEKALAIVRPGGLVLWHDYAGPTHSPGVYRALNELRERLPLVRIADTMLVAYRRPA